MKKVIAMGEALIDFIPSQKGIALKDVESFSGKVGGAPCNVVSAISKLGGKSMLITGLGMDNFGDKIIDTLKSVGVDTSAILRTDKSNTALAFVSLKENGDRDFSFYRNPSADMLFEPKDVNKNYFKNGDIFHFCSVDLIPSPMKDAHLKALEYAIQNDMIISFDPNLRFMLWNDKTLLKKTITDFLNYADIVKISDEELEFITGFKDIQTAKNSLFLKYPKIKIILYSKGKDGAELYTKNDVVQSKKYTVVAQDTTGAGDCIIGAFLYKVSKTEYTSQNLDSVNVEFLKDALDFSNACSSISVLSNGAISSYPTLEETLNFMENN